MRPASTSALARRPEVRAAPCAPSWSRTVARREPGTAELIDLLAQARAGLDRVAPEQALAAAARGEGSSSTPASPDERREQGAAIPGALRASRSRSCSGGSTRTRPAGGAPVPLDAARDADLPPGLRAPAWPRRSSAGSASSARPTWSAASRAWVAAGLPVEQPVVDSMSMMTTDDPPWPSSALAARRHGLGARSTSSGRPRSPRRSCVEARVGRDRPGASSIGAGEGALAAELRPAAARGRCARSRSTRELRVRAAEPLRRDGRCRDRLRRRAPRRAAG